MTNFHPPLHVSKFSPTIYSPPPTLRSISESKRKSWIRRKTSIFLPSLPRILDMYKHLRRQQDSPELDMAFEYSERLNDIAWYRDQLSAQDTEMDRLRDALDIAQGEREYYRLSRDEKERELREVIEEMKKIKQARRQIDESVIVPLETVLRVVRRIEGSLDTVGMRLSRGKFEIQNGADAATREGTRQSVWIES